MLGSTKKRLLIVVSGLLLAASVLTACTYSVPGGIAGVIGALALGAALLGLGASTGGCTNSCLSMVACLSPAIDAGPDGSDGGPEVGPCLQPPLPDASPDASPDSSDGPVEVGPCLQPPLPDAGPDMKVGPCLAPPAPDMGLGALEPGPRQGQPPPQDNREAQRERAIARLAGRLPRDVAARLGGRGGDDGSA